MRDEAVLLRRAEEALPGCYAPYSGIRIAAVLEASDGSLHTGVNVENASYGLTICAERSAVSAAAAAGKRKFLRILIYSPDCLPLPCGACRQVLGEFCGGEVQVVAASPDGKEVFTLDQLLPHPFDLKKEGSEKHGK